MPAARIFALRPDEPLRHRRLGDEERAGDLRCRQAAEHPQRQRDLRVDASAGWQQVKISASRSSGIVLTSSSSSSGASSTAREPLELSAPLRLAAQPVDRAVAGGGDDPGAGVRRDAVAGPALRGDRERLLDGVLGEVEVAERADQDRDRAPELLPERLGDRSAASSSADDRPAAPRSTP